MGPIGLRSAITCDNVLDTFNVPCAFCESSGKVRNPIHRRRIHTVVPLSFGELVHGGILYAYLLIFSCTPSQTEVHLIYQRSELNTHRRWRLPLKRIDPENALSIRSLTFHGNKFEPGDIDGSVVGVIKSRRFAYQNSVGVGYEFRLPVEVDPGVSLKEAKTIVSTSPYTQHRPELTQKDDRRLQGHHLYWGDREQQTSSWVELS